MRRGCIGLSSARPRLRNWTHSASLLLSRILDRYQNAYIAKTEQSVRRHGGALPGMRPCAFRLFAAAVFVCAVQHTCSFDLKIPVEHSFGGGFTTAGSLEGSLFDLVSLSSSPERITEKCCGSLKLQKQQARDALSVYALLQTQSRGESLTFFRKELDSRQQQALADLVQKDGYVLAWIPCLQLL